MGDRRNVVFVACGIGSFSAQIITDFLFDIQSTPE